MKANVFVFEVWKINVYIQYNICIDVNAVMKAAFMTALYLMARRLLTG